MLSFTKKIVYTPHAENASYKNKTLLPVFCDPNRPERSGSGEAVSTKVVRIIKKVAFSILKACK